MSHLSWKWSKSNVPNCVQNIPAHSIHTHKVMCVRLYLSIPYTLTSKAGVASWGGVDWNFIFIMYTNSPLKFSLGTNLFAMFLLVVFLIVALNRKETENRNKTKMSGEMGKKATIFVSNNMHWNAYCYCCECYECRWMLKRKLLLQAKAARTSSEKLDVFVWMWWENIFIVIVCVCVYIFCSLLFLGFYIINFCWFCCCCWLCASLIVSTLQFFLLSIPGYIRAAMAQCSRSVQIYAWKMFHRFVSHDDCHVCIQFPVLLYSTAHRHTAK